MTRDILGVVHRVGEPGMDLGGAVSFFDLLLLEIQLEAFEHESDAGELLAKIIMQFNANTPPLSLGNIKQLLFEPFPRLDGILQLIEGRSQVSGALLDAYFQLIIGVP